MNQYHHYSSSSFPHQMHAASDSLSTSEIDPYHHLRAQSQSVNPQNHFFPAQHPFLSSYGVSHELVVSSYSDYASSQLYAHHNHFLPEYSDNNAIYASPVQIESHLDHNPLKMEDVQQSYDLHQYNGSMELSHNTTELANGQVGVSYNHQLPTWSRLGAIGEHELASASLASAQNNLRNPSAAPSALSLDIASNGTGHQPPLQSAFSMSPPELSNSVSPASAFSMSSSTPALLTPASNYIHLPAATAASSSAQPQPPPPRSIVPPSSVPSQPKPPGPIMQQQQLLTPVTPSPSPIERKKASADFSTNRGPTNGHSSSSSSSDPTSSGLSAATQQQQLQWPSPAAHHHQQLMKSETPFHPGPSELQRSTSSSSVASVSSKLASTTPAQVPPYGERSPKASPRPSVNSLNANAYQPSPITSTAGLSSFPSSAPPTTTNGKPITSSITGPGGRKKLGGKDKSPHVACNFCRRRKIACVPGPSGDKDIGPCMPCAKRTLECLRPSFNRRGHRKPSSSSAPSNGNTSGSNNKRKSSVVSATTSTSDSTETDV